jgi:hypothetical protein
MGKDYSNKNLQKASFKNEDLSNVSFAESDLRGTDFSGANLTGADLTHVKTGITPLNTILIFIPSLIVSLISTYFAVLAGHTVHVMLASKDPDVRLVGVATIVIVIVFILYYYWNGGRKAIKFLIVPVVIVAAVIGIINYVSGLGTGMAMLYQIIALLLVVVMFIVGTIARTAAGSLSIILFLLVAVAGSLFSESIGGGTGATIMAFACAQISKRALGGAKGIVTLRKIAFFITRKFGTSFRGASLAHANFSRSKIRNADFSNADVPDVNWSQSRKINCLMNDTITTEKKEHASITILQNA